MQGRGPAVCGERSPNFAEGAREGNEDGEAYLRTRMDLLRLTGRSRSDYASQALEELQKGGMLEMDGFMENGGAMRIRPGAREKDLVWNNRL